MNELSAHSGASLRLLLKATTIFSLFLVSLFNVQAQCMVTHASFQNGDATSAIVLGSPASLINFTVMRSDNKALLNWSTILETPGDHFNIERSAEGINWTTIGTVNGNGNNTSGESYKYTDVKPLKGMNAYRLKQVNADGKYNYSLVRNIRFNGSWMLSLFPNPAPKGNITVQSSETITKLWVVNAAGETVIIKTINNPLDTNYILNIATLTTGVYLMQVTNTTGGIQNLTLIKSN